MAKTKDKKSLKKLSTKNRPLDAHISAQKGRKDVSRFLIEQVANINLKSGEEKSALEPISGGKNRIDAKVNANEMKEDYEYDSEKNKKSVSKKNPLDVLRKEIAQGNTDNVLKKDLFGLMPLHRASTLNDVLAVKSILSTFAIDHINDGEVEFLNSALHLACVGGNVDIIELLIEKGANINSKNKNDDTPLHLAAVSEKCQWSAIKLLIDAGANVDSINNSKVTPLHISAQRGRRDVSQLLLERGADVNLKNVEDKSALELCNDPDVRNMILQKFRVMRDA